MVIFPLFEAKNVTYGYYVKYWGLQWLQEKHVFLTKFCN
jgi:hypothetical protein